MTTLPNLSELIDQNRPDGMDRGDLAKTLAVSPSTLSRWSARMPGPETVRAVATALDLPYAVVLAAALRSGGYAENLGDVLNGHQVTLVARDPAEVDTDDGDEPGGVFTDPTAAREWARIRGAIDWRNAIGGNGDVAVGSVVIDRATVPDHIVVFKATWWHSKDVVEVDEYGIFTEWPEGLDREVVRIDSVRESGLAFELSAYGTAADETRQLVADQVAALRADRLLLGVNDRAGVGMDDRILHDGRLDSAKRAERRRAMADLLGPKREPDPELLGRIEKMAANLDNIPYVWGGVEPPLSPAPAQDGGGEAPAPRSGLARMAMPIAPQKWVDPIRTVRVQPSSPDSTTDS